MSIKRKDGMKVASKVALIVASFVWANTVNAGLISSRVDLQTLLGGPGTVEDFESFSVGGAVAVSCDTGDTLDASSVCNGQGPGLVSSGIALKKPTNGGFQWDAAGYFGAPSKEFLIGAPSAQPLTIDFITGVGAFGLDLRAFIGNAASATVTILGLDDITVIGTVSGIALGGDGVPVFTGWSDVAGIGGFSLSQNGPPWSPIIDNLEWGGADVEPVPVPATLALFSLGLVGLGWSRRKKA